MLSGTGAQHLSFNQCAWALHPGGPMILQAICDRLGLAKDQVSSAWEVLRVSTAIIYIKISRLFVVHVSSFVCFLLFVFHRNLET